MSRLIGHAIEPILPTVINGLLHITGTSVIRGERLGIIAIGTVVVSHQASTAIERVLGVPGIDPHTSGGRGHKLGNTLRTCWGEGVGIKLALLIDLAHIIDRWN